MATSTNIDGITIVDSPDLRRMVRATADLYTDSGYTRRGGVSGFGRSIRKGQLVNIEDPVVRQNIGWFETVSRPLVSEDLPVQK